jgi:hypothetical protein
MPDFPFYSKLRALTVVKELLEGKTTYGTYKRSFTKRRCLPNGDRLPGPTEGFSVLGAKQYKDQFWHTTKHPDHHSMVGDVQALGTRFYFRHAVDSVVLESRNGRWVKTKTLDNVVTYESIEHESWCFWPDVEEILGNDYVYGPNGRLKIKSSAMKRVAERLETLKLKHGL